MQFTDLIAYIILGLFLLFGFIPCIGKVYYDSRYPAGKASYIDCLTHGWFVIFACIIVVLAGIALGWSMCLVIEVAL